MARSRSLPTEVIAHAARIFREWVEDRRRCGTEGPLTQTAIERLTGIPQARVSDWTADVNGMNRGFGIHALIAISRTTGRSINELLGPEYAAFVRDEPAPKDSARDFADQLKVMPSLRAWVAESDNDVAVGELVRALALMTTGAAAAYSATNDFRGLDAPHTGWATFFDDVRVGKIRERQAQEGARARLAELDADRGPIVIPTGGRKRARKPTRRKPAKRKS